MRLNLSRIAVFGLVLAGAALGLWRYAFAPAAVTVAEIRRGPVAEAVYATGVVEPVRWAKVIAYQRRRIVDICDCEGKTVKAGDMLARLDDAEARANLAELEARRQMLANDVERISGLVRLNAATRTSLDQASTSLHEFDARIEAARQRISDLVLRAPIDGVVLRRDGQIGDMAGTGAGDALFWVGQPKPLRVNAEVNEEDVARVAKGQKVLLRHDGFPGRELTASVDEITPKGDPQAKTFRVYLALPADSPLRIGMTVEANIIVAERADALVAPAEALLSGAAERVADGRVRRVNVKTGVRGARFVEILSGLSAGDLVVSPARVELKDGARVTIVAAP